MSTVNVVSPSSEEAGTAELPDAIFGAKVNVPLIHQVVVAQRAAARQGTASTKTRGEVSGGGRKPYRQKGTGRARQGSTRAPQFTGGGVSHGPVPRDYTQKTPKKMKAAALRGALSDRAANERVFVVTAFAEGDVPRTKDALAVLNKVTDGAVRNVLVVTEHDDELSWKSLRNVPFVHLLAEDQLNTYDVLASDLPARHDAPAAPMYFVVVGAAAGVSLPALPALSLFDDGALSLWRDYARTMLRVRQLAWDEIDARRVGEDRLAELVTAVNALSSEQQRSATLQGRVAALEADVGAARAERERLQGELARATDAHAEASARLAFRESLQGWLRWPLAVAKRRLAAGSS